MYPPELTAPMEAQLVAAGVAALKTPEDVTAALAKEGTTLVVVNSVCGCAAGTARPGVLASLQNAKLPTQATTVFAGVDGAAVQKAREFMIPFPPSSPAVALFKDGQLVHMLERHHIEGHSAEAIAANLSGAYDEYC
ncbi:BrxA/BrxB family bacilliredoxin [Wenyingzhuangia sp. IMCC45574]